MPFDPFDYDLPPELIAQTPISPRSASRLMVVGQGDEGLEDRRFADLTDYVRPGDLLVFNDTRVVPARFYGQRATGGRVEMLLERFLDGDGRAHVALRASKSPRIGEVLILEGGLRATVLGRAGEFTEVLFSGSEDVMGLIDRVGHVPLPPYITRPDNEDDRTRYQTVYARAPGAVAAPTAGLHFDEDLLARLTRQGVESAFVTLHVGAGTFRPVRPEALAQGRLHPERVLVSEDCVAAIAAAQARGGRVVAVGTTTARALEAAAASGTLQPYAGDTDLFIQGGFRFQVIEGLITNFHLPRSTLLMLVCAFAGHERVMNAYRRAVAARYRFFSYGDAMLLWRAMPLEGAHAQGPGGLVT
ncbi:tRNA preQ1(34) S-adenosylmethionine ribosyltransferase-isomerase QueA [Acidiferrobacter sp.]|uniref:tRNA preQ1(34) S-adenosylmethionine ribosyltransferase-isomerase QueA n=1 Tax=Acidiferrobacter sp. TaxID=1872107 RepID=UPI002636C7C4|nr:tRNA preQ1(34) S-adenosylmethionine ribosyltransferase-isomerase QueA [Acidiferrobacter sp.]